MQMDALFRANMLNAWDEVLQMTRENYKRQQDKRAARTGISGAQPPKAGKSGPQAPKAWDSRHQVPWPNTMEKAEQMRAYMEEKLGEATLAPLSPSPPQWVHCATAHQTAHIWRSA